MAKQLLRLSAYTGKTRYDQAGRSILKLLTAAMAQYPQAFAESLNAADMLIQGIAEVAIVGNPETDAAQAILAVLRQPFRPNVITALTPRSVEEHETIPLLSYRSMREGQATVYVCRRFACQLPVTSAAETEALLAEWQ